MKTLPILSGVLLAGLLAGCGSPPGSPPAVAREAKPAAVAVVESSRPSEASPAPPAPPPPAPKPAPPPPPEPFRYPGDVGGRQVASALAPGPLPGPALPRASGPRPRSSDIDQGELPLPPVAVTPPTPPLPPARSSRPSPPPERVPTDLGQPAAENPANLRLPERPAVRSAAPVLPGAGDVPALARPLPDRVSLDDPTAELAAARVVFTVLPFPAAPEWFARFGIPDPFELAAHLRGPVGSSDELGRTPVVVPPARP